RAQALRARRRAEIRRLSREIVGHEEERASRAAPDQAIKPLALGGLEHGLALGRQSRADLGGRGADPQLPGYREEARLAEEQHERLTDPALDPEETGRVDPKAPLRVRGAGIPVDPAQFGRDLDGGNRGAVGPGNDSPEEIRLGEGGGAERRDEREEREL